MFRGGARVVAAACLSAAAWTVPPARAQAPITIVTSFGSAPAADIVARLLATEFTPMLDAPVVVKNTTGAAGTIASNEVVAPARTGARCCSRRSAQSPSSRASCGTPATPPPTWRRSAW